MKQLVLIAFFFFAWQFGFCQPECFRTTDSSLFSPATRLVLEEIYPFYEQLPGGYNHVITPSDVILKSSIDTSYEQLELLAWDKNIRIRSFYLPYYAKQIATDSTLIESYLSCSIRDSAELTHRDRCIIFGTSFATYAYGIFRPYLTQSQWLRLSLSWLKTTKIRDLSETLLDEWSQQENYKAFFREILRDHDQPQVLYYLMNSATKEDQELLLGYAKRNPQEAHWLMREFPDQYFIAYVKNQLALAPDYAFTDDLMCIAKAIDENFYEEVTSSICDRLDPTKIYSFGQNIYNSDYYRKMEVADKHELLLKLLPSLHFIDSLDINYLAEHQQEVFDQSISKRLVNNLKSENQAYLDEVLDRIFTIYSENWTDEKKEICRQLCGQCDNRTAVLATIALLEHNDPQTSELLLRHFQMDTTNPEGYRMRHFYSIDAMTFSNDSILFQKVGAVLLQQFLKDELHTDAFNYLNILDRSKIPGFYNILLKDLEKGPTSSKHPVIASFLLTKNNATINKRLVAIYQSFLNQPEVEYYNTEIGFYLTEYGLL